MDLEALITALRSRHREAGRLAVALLAACDGKIDGKRYGHRSLAAKIAALRNRDHDARVWWSRRVSLREKLGGLLSLPGSKTATPEIDPKQVFAEFPSLKALDVRVDEPCDLGFSAWHQLPEGRSRWIEAPAGAGCSLVARRLHVLARWAHVSARSLTEAVAEIQRRGLASRVVIDLDGEPSDDRGASQWLRLRGGVLVLAHHPPPGKASKLGRASITFTSTDGGVVLVGPVPHADDWDHVGWRPAASWRNALVHWAHRRLSSAGTSVKWAPDQLCRALDEVDPVHVRVDTPSALLWLLSGATKAAFSEDLRDAIQSQHALESFLMERYFAASRASTKQARRRADALRRLLHDVHTRRVCDLEQRWTGRVREDDLNVRAEHRTRRRPDADTGKAQRWARKAIRARVRNAGSDYSVGPRWVADAFAVGGLVERLRGDARVDVLALGCAHDRSGLVDAALDELKPEAFEACLRRVVARSDDSSFAVAAALETLFGACARRFERREKLPEKPLVELADAVFSRWSANRPPSDAVSTDRERVNPCPVSRPGAKSIVGDGNAWIADCWSWSLLSGIARPVKFFGEAWLFPGWCSPARPDVCAVLSDSLTPPHWPTFGGLGDRVDHVWDSSGFRRLERLAAKVLERVARTQLTLSEAFTQPIAAPVLPTVCANSTWRDRVETWDSISKAVQAFGVGHRVRAKIGGLPDSERAEVARWLFQLAAKCADENAVNEPPKGPARGLVAVLSRMQSHDGSPLVEFVLEALPTGDLENVFAQRGALNVELLWDSLAVGVARTRLEQAWARDLAATGASPDVVDAFLCRTMCSDEIVEPIACSAGHDGAVAVWNRRPDLALRLLKAEFGNLRGGFWISRAPESRLPDLLAEVEATAPSKAPGWLWNWLRWLALTQPRFAARANDVLVRTAAANAWLRGPG